MNHYRTNFESWKLTFYDTFESNNGFNAVPVNGGR